MGLRPTKGDEDARGADHLVAYAHGSNEGVTEPRTVRGSVPLFFNHGPASSTERYHVCPGDAWIYR